MKYKLKVLIDGIEFLEDEDLSEYIPEEDDEEMYIDDDETSEEFPEEEPEEEPEEDYFSESAYPTISDVRLKLSTSLNGIAIGDSASNALYFTLNNPNKSTYDGSVVQLFVSPIDEDDDPKNAAETEDGEDDILIDEDAEEIDYEEEPEEDAPDEPIEYADEAEDDDETSDVEEDEDDEEESEDLTPEEEADLVIAEVGATGDEFDFFEGEEIASVEEETDEEEESEWIEMGTYYVFQTVNNGNSVSFMCLDGFCRLTDLYEPPQVETDLQTLYDDIRTKVLEKYNIVINEYTFTEDQNITVNWNYNFTYRQALGYIASFVGGYVSFDTDGTCGIAFCVYADTDLIKEELLSYMPNSSGETIILGLRCNTSDVAYSEELLELGADTYISFANPMMTEELLESVLDVFRGIRYTGAAFSCLWEPHMQAGEFARVMTQNEADNLEGLQNTLELEMAEAVPDDEKILELKSDINSVGDIVLMSNMTIDFNGEAVAYVDSVLQSEQQNSTTYLDTDKKAMADSVNQVKKHLMFRPDSVEILGEDGKSYAHYGETARVGVEDGNNITIVRNSISFNDNERSVFSMEVGETQLGGDLSRLSNKGSGFGSWSEIAAADTNDSSEGESKVSIYANQDYGANVMSGIELYTRQHKGDTGHIARLSLLADTATYNLGNKSEIMMIADDIRIRANESLSLSVAPTIAGHDDPVGTVKTFSGTASSLANGTSPVAISTACYLPAGAWLVMGRVQFASLGGKRASVQLDRATTQFGTYVGFNESVETNDCSGAMSLRTSIVGNWNADSYFKIYGWQASGASMSNLNWYVRAIRIL